MSQADLKHEWTFKRNSPLIRFYLWVWDADPKAITFCKLFWGILLAPLCLLLLWPIGFVLNRVSDYLDKRKERQFNQELAQPEDEPMSATEALAEEAPSFRERQLENVGEFFAKPRPRRVMRIVGMTAMVVGGLAIVGVVGYLVVTNLTGVLVVLAWIAGIVVTCFVAAGILIVCDRRGVFKASGRFFRDGFRAVKTNTCPRIVIEQPGIRAKFTVVDRASGPLREAEDKTRRRGR
jgi:hypothetical protein